MKIHKHTLVQTSFISETRPEIRTPCPDLEPVIGWADDHPIVWDIVTRARSKAFGRGACVYIGWAQHSMAPAAILERVKHFKKLIDEHGPRRNQDDIFRWRAQFTLAHYQEHGFRGGFFQQHDARYPRSCLTLDYTPATFELVLDRFCAWMDPSYDIKRITLDGKTVRLL
jgi:hypothetical protein